MRQTFISLLLTAMLVGCSTTIGTYGPNPVVYNPGYSNDYVYSVGYYNNRPYWGNNYYYLGNVGGLNGYWGGGYYNGY